MEALLDHPAGRDLQTADDAPCSLGSGVPVLIRSSGSSQAGLIHDINPHSLSILVGHALTEGSQVTIEFGSENRVGQIVSCQCDGRKYEANVVIPDQNEGDLRTAERFPVTQEMTLWTGSSESQLDAVVTDLSTCGIGLETSTPLPKGETVMAESDSTEAFGIVRYCRPLPDGRFHAGVEVFHVMPKADGI
jgi:hypothetical protein